MEPSILSLIPPTVTIALAIATKRIFLALGTGIVLGALLHAEWDIAAALSLIGEVAGGLVIDEGAIAEEMYISAFVLLLGVLTSFIYVSGGLHAFTEWATTRVRSRFQAQLTPILTGIVIFSSAEPSAGRSRTSTGCPAPSCRTSWTRPRRRSSS